LRVVIFVLLIPGIIFRFGLAIKRGKGLEQIDTPRDILKKRYAKGDKQRRIRENEGRYHEALKTKPVFLLLGSFCDDRITSICNRPVTDPQYEN